MDTNLCSTYHLDRDVLLPPRKRLLAGLKKHNSGPQPHQISPTSNEVDRHLNNKLNHRLSSNTSSLEESAESSRLAAITATSAAKAARAVADEKSVIAAEADAAAKIAVDLSASFSEETASTESKDKHSKNNKVKKHVPVQILHDTHQQFGTSPTDEELARKLHRDMNSSLRIAKNSSSSSLNNDKHKMKLLPPFEKARVANRGMTFDGNVESNCRINAEPGEVKSERCSREIGTIKVDGKRAHFCNVILLKTGNGDAGSRQSRERIHEIAEDTSPSGRGRVKLKKVVVQHLRC